MSVDVRTAFFGIHLQIQLFFFFWDKRHRIQILAFARARPNPRLFQLLLEFFHYQLVSEWILSVVCEGARLLHGNFLPRFQLAGTLIALLLVQILVELELFFHAHNIFGLNLLYIFKVGQI